MQLFCFFGMHIMLSKVLRLTCHNLQGHQLQLLQEGQSQADG